MIILEGPDGSGKTTIIERLGYERRSFKALRGGVGEDGRGNWGAQDPAPIAYARQVLQGQADEHRGWRAGTGGSGIALDRFHLSETVYGPILRQGSGITNEEVVVLDRLLRARGVYRILCLPPFLETMKNVQREGRERPSYQTLTFLRQAYLAWEKIAYDRAGGVDYERFDLLYDYTRTPEVPRIPLRPTCPPGVIGSPSARFLLVGERSNLPLDLPFFSMKESSGFLNRCLWYAGFREEEIALTNAFAADGRPRDLRACLLASTSYVVALGKDAGAEIDRQRVGLHMPILNAPHPQYWKRFHTRNQAAYVERLKEIREAVCA